MSQTCSNSVLDKNSKVIQKQKTNENGDGLESKNCHNEKSRDSSALKKEKVLIGHMKETKVR